MPRFQFDAYVVDTDTAEVAGPDGPRPVEPQVFDVLAHLVAHAGRLVTKEELLESVWGDTFVSESALTTRIKQARRAVDDDGVRQWAIKTLHGRGYRFLPEVLVSSPTPTTAQDSEPTGETPPALPEELRAEPRRPFCGRAAEHLAGTRLVRGSAPDAAAGWVWILGEPGIGKSRLATELARTGHEHGQRVVIGRNSEDLRVPYQPFVEILGQLVELGEEPPPGLGPLSAGAGVGTTAAHASAGTALDDEARRYALLETFADWLASCAARVPLLVVVDDVHWASDSTLQMLSHLQQRPNAAAVSLVLTARDTAPDAHPRVADLLATAQGRPRTVVLRLAGLSADEASRLLGDRPEVDVAEAVRATAGNPLLLQALDSEAGPVDLASAVRRRLATLGESVQETLRMMSVLGLEFELTVAARALRRDPWELLEDLETAAAARLLDDIGVDRFRFTHALVRSSLREQVGSTRRARMHQRIMHALEELYGDDPAHAPQLAHHTEQAALADPGLRPVAADRLRRAAALAGERYSFAEAAQLLGRAREIHAEATAGERARSAVDLGIADVRAGRNIPAARAFEEALDLAEELGNAALQVEAAARYEDATWRPGLHGARALGHVERAIALLDGEAAATITDIPQWRARLALARLRALALSGRRSECAEAFADARRLALALGSPTAEAAALSVYLGHVLFFRPGPEVASMVARLAELEPLIGDGDVALHALHDRIMHAVITGDVAGRRRLVTRLAGLQEQWHSQFWHWIRVNQEAMEAFYVGDLAGAERLAASCLDAARELPEEDGSGTFGLRMFLIRREQDRLAAVAPLLQRVMSRADEGGLWTPGLAWLLAETGRPDEATHALAGLREDGFAVPVDALWSTVMVMLIETVVTTRDREACVELLELFSPVAGTNVTMGAGALCFGRADRYLGMLSWALGDLPAAEEHLGRALAGDDEGGSVLWTNESRLWLSRVRRAQGHTVEADAMVRVVVAEADEHGLARLSRLGREALAPGAA